MPISSRNSRIELVAIQVTGTDEGKAGVYARLLQDKDNNKFWDLRYFGYSEEKKRHIESPKGLIFNREQILQVRKALKNLWDLAYDETLNAPTSE